MHPKKTDDELGKLSEDCVACERRVFQVIPRFRVKFEVTDGKATCVFVLFDSEMSYMIEKSCAFFVAQS
ncbi:replication factor-A carboxy-terminal domain protein, partial [Trifolium medium]|nr:replication factor-A carboxy-terminal domain protein [Trifolium medium]